MYGEDRFQDAVLTVIILILAFGLGIVVGHLRSYNVGYVDAVEDVPDHICVCENEEIPDCILSCDCRCPPEPQFLRIARDVADEVEYSRERWNCHDKSLELVRRLDMESDWEGRFEVVYGLHLVYGEDDSYWGYHAWVCTGNRDICIEATNGRILTPDNYEKRYREDR